MSHELLPLRKSKNVPYTYWAALSDSLTELSLAITPPDEQRLMALLPQLKNLTSLKVHRVLHDNGEVPESFVIDHSGLRSLHMSSFKVKDLTLECPGLSSLTMDCCFVHGHLLLLAPLEDFSCGPTFVPCVREGFVVSNFLGLTRLRCLLGEWDSLQMLYELLPRMSRLKALSLVLECVFFLSCCQPAYK